MGGAADQVVGGSARGWGTLHLGWVHSSPFPFLLFKSFYLIKKLAISLNAAFISFSFQKCSATPGPVPHPYGARGRAAACGGKSTSPSFFAIRLSSNPGPGPRGGPVVQVSACRPPAVWVPRAGVEVGRALSAQRSHTSAWQSWKLKGPA